MAKKKKENIAEENAHFNQMVEEAIKSVKRHLSQHANLVVAMTMLLLVMDKDDITPELYDNSTKLMKSSSKMLNDFTNFIKSFENDVLGHEVVIDE